MILETAVWQGGTRHSSHFQGRPRVADSSPILYPAHCSGSAYYTEKYGVRKFNRQIFVLFKFKLHVCNLHLVDSRQSTDFTQLYFQVDKTLASYKAITPIHVLVNHIQ